MKNIDINFDLTKILLSLVLLLLIVGIFVLGKIFNDRVSKVGRHKTLRSVVFGIVKWVCIIVLFIVILAINGIDVSSMIAGLGIVSLVVGLALQDYLKDIVMGIHILTDNFYAVGDAVVYGGYECIVADLSIRTTKLRIIENGASIVLCNRKVEEITRMSHLVDIDVPLSYSEDVNKVREVLKDLADKISDLPDIEYAIFKGTQKFDSSAILYKMRFFCEPAKQKELSRTVHGIIQDGLNSEGIKIPFTQMDVHFDEGAFK